MWVPAVQTLVIWLSEQMLNPLIHLSSPDSSISNGEDLSAFSLRLYPTCHTQLFNKAIINKTNLIKNRKEIEIKTMQIETRK